MDWDKLRIFHGVAEAGSFTHAGDGLNLSQSAVSRQINALEDSLKVSLFHRHARGLILTEQGEILHRTTREVFAKLSMAEALLMDSKKWAKGSLKVTSEKAFGINWLVPRIKEFTDFHPEVHLSLMLSDEDLNLSMREADVAIRSAEPTQGDLIKRPLGVVYYHLYGTVEYLQKRGIPKTPADLRHHTLISMPINSNISKTDNWLLKVAAVDPEERKDIILINDLSAIFKAVECGHGIAALPTYLVRGHADIVRVLPDLTGLRHDMYLVYPEEMRNSKRIGVFRDFLVKQVEGKNL